MNRFLPGLVVGLLLGGGGVYLALEKPWQGGETADAAFDAGPTTAKPDKPRKRRGKRKRRTATDDGEIVLSAADQKLVWKGEAVALPDRAVDMGGAGDARPLSGAEINQVIKNRSGAVIDCISHAAGNAPLKSAVTLKLLVNGDGNVEKIRVRAPAYLFDHGFNACAREAARKMRFPGTGAYTVVTAPFDIY